MQRHRHLLFVSIAFFTTRVIHEEFQGNSYYTKRLTDAGPELDRFCNVMETIAPARVCPS